MFRILKYITLCKQNFDYIRDTRVIYIQYELVAALSRFASRDAVENECGIPYMHLMQLQAVYLSQTHYCNVIVFRRICHFLK
jgi:hypothetical protein